MQNYSELLCFLLFSRLLNTNFVGNDRLHLLTASGYTKLRVDLQDFDGGSVYAEYSLFTVGDAASNYIMHCSGHSGTTGEKHVL